MLWVAKYSQMASPALSVRGTDSTYCMNKFTSMEAYCCHLSNKISWCNSQRDRKVRTTPTCKKYNLQYVTVNKTSRVCCSNVVFLSGQDDKVFLQQCNSPTFEGQTRFDLSDELKRLPAPTSYVLNNTCCDRTKNMFACQTSLLQLHPRRNTEREKL